MAVDKASVLARIATAMVKTTTLPLPDRLCQACVDLTGTDGGAITLSYTQADRVTVASTNALAARLEDLQEVVGEGPGWDASRSGVMVSCLLGDRQAGAHDQWPMFISAAADLLGSAQLYSMPMHPAGRAFGVVSLHQLHGRSDAELDLEEAQFLADAVGAALLREPDWSDDIDGSSPWPARAGIHQATGMVIAQLGIPGDDALALLRAHAYAHGVSLVDIAGDIVQRRLDFSHLINQNEDDS